MKLHLYVLPAKGNGDTEGARRAELSFGQNIAMQVTKGIRSSQLWMTAVHYADWYGYIFDDEVIDARLRRALSVMIHHEKIDYFTLFRKRKKENGEIMLSVTPRIFRRHVALGKGTLNPVNNGRLLRGERILDGWVIGQ